jgi:hypothetical protein
VFFLILPVAVKAGEACELEDRIPGLLLQVGTPIPGRSEPPIDARPSLKEIIRPAPVKAEGEKVAENILFELGSAPKGCVDVDKEVGVLDELALNLLEGQDDRVQDPGDLIIPGRLGLTVRYSAVGVGIGRTYR